MENAANLLLGTVLIFSLIALSALILLRGKRRRRPASRPDLNARGEPAAPAQTKRTGLFSKLFGIFRRGNRRQQSLMPTGDSPLTDFADMPAVDPAPSSEAVPVAASENLVAGALPEEQEALLAAVRTDSSEELTIAEADAFRALSGEQADAGGQSSSEDGSPSEPETDEDKVFETQTLDNTLAGAFKVARIVDTKREALLARVPSVDSQDLIEAIRDLTTRVKVYVPAEPNS